MKVRVGENDRVVREFGASLAPEDIAENEATLDAAFQWALSVASVAEIVKESPFADPARLDLIQAIVARPFFDDDADKNEFETLVGGVARQLEGS